MKTIVNNLLQSRITRWVWLATLLAAPPSHAASIVQFPVSTCTVTKGIGRLEIPVRRQNDIDTVVTVAIATAPVTATPGVDYTPVATNLTFLAGETNRTLSFPILEHGLVGPTRTLRVFLSQPNGAELGSRTNLTVSILNGNKGLHFYVPAVSVNEDAGEVTIKVARGDGGDALVGVDYVTTDVTAKAGQDYTTNAGTIVFAPGEVLKSFTVPILNDALMEPAKTLRVTLSNPTGGGVLSSPSVTTVTIKDTDWVLQFDAAKYFAREDAEYVRIGIIQGENDLATAVDFTTVDATAIVGLDYVGVTNTVRFDAGERLKWVKVPILHDSLKEPGKNFRVMLSNAIGGAVLGTPQSATITIADNDPGVGFATNTFWASAGADVADVTVVRGSDELLHPFTVDYQTANGSAQAGVDYQATSNRLTFETNQILQTIAIPILQNPAAKGQQVLTVRLSNASAGIPLGTTITQVKILHPKGYYPILPPIDAKPKLRLEGGVNLLSWEGDGALQRAEQVTGPWENLAGVASPYATKPPLPMGFYRIQSTRPTEVYVPSGYDGQTPLPLILMLHAMGSTNDFPDLMATVRGGFPLVPLAESRGFLLCYPSGTVDAAGRWFWNGTDVLSFSGPDVDDSGYLRGVIEEIQRRFAVDPKRIYVTGYSSGGNMSQRLALEHGDLIAAIAAMTGAGIYYDPNACHPSQPVNVLQICGTLDHYLGGTLADFGLPVVAEDPGPVRTVQIWAGLNGCQDPVIEAAPSLDLTTQVAGIDTTVLRYTQCPPGGSVELWTVNGGDHYLFWENLSPHFLEYLVDWLLAHPKP